MRALEDRPRWVDGALRTLRGDQPGPRIRGIQRRAQDVDLGVRVEEGAPAADPAVRGELEAVRGLDGELVSGRQVALAGGDEGPGPIALGGDVADLGADRLDDPGALGERRRDRRLAG